MSQLANKVKSDFPIFHNSDLVYLDSAATSQKPQVVLDTVNSVYTKSNANVHRALYSLGSISTEKYEKARDKVANFIGANSSKEIIFTSGATESLNLLAFSLGMNLNSKDEIPSGVSIESASYIENNKEIKDESIVYAKDTLLHEKNGLEEYTPKLFSDETSTEISETDIADENSEGELFQKEATEEDDFEIPAFLRRQKF